MNYIDGLAKIRIKLINTFKISFYPQETGFGQYQLVLVSPEVLLADF